MAGVDAAEADVAGDVAAVVDGDSCTDSAASAVDVEGDIPVAVSNNRLGVILAFLRKFWISRTWSGKHICIHMGKGFRANGTRNQQKVTLSGNGHKQFMPVFSSGSQRFFLH